ncbi:TetR/AcrR family transcriptional regulator [uncultured Anaerococcus sp.]|uniref:TetR/AcrR family transcriptional regulator n=1 Tax=uncultured Anaerococcus sp. TaxID=293428 RepID=UPI002633ACC7|nr:TetR/AcrR family transcriptional regulator [uncultured Anaerococcus sp.]
MIITRDIILDESRKLVAKDGLKALSIRKLANNSNVAIGTIYNYFSSKDDLMISTIESVWEDILSLDQARLDTNNFIDYLSNIFKNLSLGIEKYPNFFNIHSLSFKAQNISRAKDSMTNYIEKVSENLMEILERDPNIRKDVFDDEFTKDDLLEFILKAIHSFIAENNHNEDLILKIIKKLIY